MSARSAESPRFVAARQPRTEPMLALGGRNAYVAVASAAAWLRVLHAARTSLSRTRLRIGRARIYDRRQGVRARRARCRVACRVWARQSGGRLELPGTARAVLTLSIVCGSV
jgi:hypothetical protein